MSDIERLQAALKQAEEALSAPDSFDVTVTEEDENDPVLLAELQAIKEGRHEQPSIESDTHHIEPRLERQQAPLVASRAPVGIEEDLHVGQQPPRAPAQSRQLSLNEQINELKIKCVQLKRAGHIQEAQRTLLALKRLQAQQRELEPEIAAPAISRSPVAQSSRSARTQPATPRTSSLNVPPAQPPSGLDEMKGVIPESSIPTEDPEELDEEAVTELGTPQQDDQMRRQKIFARLDSLLVNQITEYHNRALREKNAGRKAEALAYLRKKKEWMRDLELVRLAQANPSTPPPQYHIETIEHKTEIIHEDMSSHEMEIEIIRLIDVKPPSLNDKTLDLYVTCEIPYPNHERPQKFQTPVAKNSFSPVFNFKQRIRIERNRLFERFIKQKKLTFEVVRPATWFFGRATSIGKCEMKLASLFDHAETTQLLDIMEGRKLNGGKAEVRVRLRTPLNPQAKHYNITQEKVLVIDRHFVSMEAPTSPSDLSASTVSQTVPQSPVAQTTFSQPSTPQSPHRPAKVVEDTKTPPHTPEPETKKEMVPTQPEQPTASTSPAVSEPESVVHPQNQPAENATDTLDLPLDDPNRVDWIVSNAVLEKEIMRTTQAISAAKKNNADTSDLELRLQQLQLRQQLLIIQIQQGRITVESYMEMLKERIVLDKKLALALKKQNRIEEAQAALLRAKLMEEELQSE